MNKDTAPEDKTIVMHAVDSWLPLTMPWLHDSIYFLPSSIESHIVCRRKINLEYFFLPNVYSLDNQSFQRKYLDKVLRKFRLRRSWDLLFLESKRHGAEILHSHFGNMAWQNIPLCKKLGIKHIASFYGYDVDRVPRLNKSWLSRYLSLFDTVDKVLCLGPFMKKRLMQLGCPEEKLLIHNLGIRVSDIPFRIRTWKPGNTLRILIASSFMEKKGIPFALEAIERLQKELSVEVTIIGGSSNEECSKIEERKILACIKEFQLSKKIRLMGYQSRDVLHAEAYKHHIFLAPSITASDGDSEGTPVVLMEMAATGMPIVSTFHSDIPHIIDNERTGFLAEERSVDGLVCSIQKWLRECDQWSDILVAGRQHIERNFDAEMQSVKLALHYRGMINYGS